MGHRADLSVTAACEGMNEVTPVASFDGSISRKQKTFDIYVVYDEKIIFIRKIDA